VDGLIGFELCVVLQQDFRSIGLTVHVNEEGFLALASHARCKRDRCGGFACPSLLGRN